VHQICSYRHILVWSLFPSQRRNQYGEKISACCTSQSGQEPRQGSLPTQRGSVVSNASWALSPESELSLPSCRDKVYSKTNTTLMDGLQSPKQGPDKRWTDSLSLEIYLDLARFTVQPRSWRQYILPKMYGVTYQKRVTFIPITLRTSNLTVLLMFSDPGITKVVVNFRLPPVLRPDRPEKTLVAVA
jgi:hypothetical protein